MASSSDNISMAVFCDFENVALGVRDANYEKFDIKPVLERLLLKGSIVVKKAYCDWERYKGFKATMHEANFELIEIPHVRQSGKNSADIRLVVDALDLCYTKSHVNTFVIISGDSDFSPLVSKLRENAKQVIGVGVKQSTSDLLVANCDEFIFYDDLVREVKRAAAKRDERKVAPAPKRSPDEGNRRKEELEARKAQAIDLVVEMFDALVSERGDSGKIWASLLKDTLKRRRPDFNETYYGFRTFGNLLEEAQNRGMLEFGRDEKSGAYVYRSSAMTAANNTGANIAQAAELPLALDGAPAHDGGFVAEQADDVQAKPESSRRRGGRGGRKQHDTAEQAAEQLAAQKPWYAVDDAEDEADAESFPAHAAQAPASLAGDVEQGVDADAESDDASEGQAGFSDDAQSEAQALPPAKEKRRTPRAGSKRTAKKEAKQGDAAIEAPVAIVIPAEQEQEQEQEQDPITPQSKRSRKRGSERNAGHTGEQQLGDQVEQGEQGEQVEERGDEAEPAAAAKPARKSPARSRRTAKPKAPPENA